MGFIVGEDGVRPTDSFVDSILNFPTPTSLTDIRSWFGAVAHVSYSFATSPVLLPFKHLLSSKTSFFWSPELEVAFKASKQEVVDQCRQGVRTFDPSLPTALSTDWCKTGCKTARLLHTGSKSVASSFRGWWETTTAKSKTMNNK